MVSAPLPVLLQRTTKTLTRRLALDDPVAPTRSAPVVCKTKKVERPSTLASTRLAELEHPCLLSVDPKAKTGKPFRKHRQHTARILLQFTANDEVISYILYY